MYNDSVVIISTYVHFLQKCHFFNAVKMFEFQMSLVIGIYYTLKQKIKFSRCKDIEVRILTKNLSVHCIKQV